MTSTRLRTVSLSVAAACVAAVAFLWLSSTISPTAPAPAAPSGGPRATREDRAGIPGARRAAASATTAAGAVAAARTPTPGMRMSEWKRLNAAAAGAADEPARTDGVLDDDAFMVADYDAFRQVVDSLNQSRDARLEALGPCMARWGERRRAAGASGNGDPVELHLAIESTDGVATIVGVDAAWPPEVDEPVRDCVRAAYVGYHFPSDHDYRVAYAWPLCSPKEGAREDGEHPVIPVPKSYRL